MYRTQATAADERIRAARAAVAERDRLAAMRDALAADVAEADRERGELATQVAKEQRDVERYDHGVWAFLYGLFKDREARLTAEQTEAAAAEAKLLEANTACTRLRQELDRITNRIAELAAADGELAAARAAKQQLLAELGAPAAAELDGIAHELAAADAETRALDEALAAGDRAVLALGRLLEALGSARSWGTFDILSDSVLASFAKRQKLDEARGIAGAAQAELILFERELADVGVALDTELASLADHHRFLDVWFDNIFSDLSVQSRIGDAIDTTQRTLQQASERVGQTRRRHHQLAERTAELLTARERLLDPA